MKTYLFAWFLGLFAIPVMASQYILGLGGLTLEMKEQDVVNKLGKPLDRTEVADYINLILKYKNMEVYFNGNSVAGMYTESEKVCTPENICPGRSFKGAIEEYGVPIAKEDGSRVLYEFYTKLEYTCWYRMTHEKEIIRSIEIACQP